MQKEFVSIIIPTYNVEKYIGFALNSLCQQSYKNFEVIIIDDGSTDSTIQLISDFRSKLNINLVQNPHTGNIGSLRNLGIELSNGKYIHFLDSDDMWEPGKLEITQKYFAKGYDLICTNGKIVDANNLVLKEKMYDSKNFDLIIKLYQLVKDNFITTSAAVKKEILTADMRFEQEEGCNAEDYALWLKIIEKFSGYFIDESLVNIRIHSSNISFRSPERRIGMLNGTIALRKKYFNYNDPKVREGARSGCNPLYKELSIIYLKKKDYDNAYRNLSLMTFKDSQLSFKSYMILGIIYWILYVINLTKKSKIS